jgi:hypothetical protein
VNYSTLTLDSCHLLHISVSAFDEIGIPALVFPGMVPYQPKIRFLDIDNNKQLMNLDWTVLKPIAQSVQVNRLFDLNYLDNLSFENNLLRFIPTAVSDTFNPSLNISFHLDGNPFCVKSPDFESDYDVC